jgi:hypothetical protein
MPSSLPNLTASSLPEKNISILSSKVGVSLKTGFLSTK